MDHQIVYTIMDGELAILRLRPYSELVKLIKTPVQKVVTGPDGKHYQIELTAVWDSGKRGDVRVMVSGDDGGLSSFHPLSVAFIMAPDGHFVWRIVGRLLISFPLSSAIPLETRN
jgi:hypothetical protein